MRIFYTIIFLFCFSASYAQKEGNIWYFGGQAGLDFNYNPPKVLLDGADGSYEGGACLSDHNGKLLFYTGGETIWNGSHKILKNGTGLLGHSSSTQAALILVHPKMLEKTYIFTNDAVGLDTCPMFINIAFHDSLIVKNKLFLKYGSEKLNAVNHQNNNDIWVSTHSYLNDTFYLYLLTKNGIIDCPVINKLSKYQSEKSGGQGQIKFSKDGRFISCSFFGFKNRDQTLAKFNSESGMINKYFLLNLSGVYASEFSPNQKFLYTSDYSIGIHQFDISKFDSASVNNSIKVIKEFGKFDREIRGIQIAADKKIYISKKVNKYLAAINLPDSAENKCIYKDSSQYLGGRQSMYGLPNFNASFFHTPPVDYSYEQDCRTNTITFEGKDTINATSFVWLFKKGSTSDSKSGKNLSYSFNDTGKWQVSFIAINATRRDTITKIITIHSKLQQDFLGEDLHYCLVNPLPLTLHAPKDLHCIHWYNETMNELSRENSVLLTQDGIYYAKATNLSFCVEWDTIKIEKGSPIAGFKVNDMCANDSAVFVNTSKYGGSYKWKFGDNETDNKKFPKHKYQTESTITFNVTLVVTLDGCSDSITKPITVNAVPVSEFNYTITGKEISLEADQTGLQKYLWKFGTTDSSITSTSTYIHNFKLPGQYKVCLKATNLVGCFSETCKTVTLGITSIETTFGIFIYPNPNKGKLYIDIAKPGNYSLKVFTPTGQLVFEKVLKGSHTNTVLLNQPIGNYMIEIGTESGEIFTKKMLLE